MGTDPGPWESCYVDPESGRAFFDGVTIYADSITDPRQDRVFPVFRKEQVFMCRQMKPLFEAWRSDRQRSQNGERSRLPLALDIGTGSGVLAIWAAINGCKVYALDISERAIRFAHYNVNRNRRREGRDERELRLFADREEFLTAEAPGIWLRQQRFDEALVVKWKRDPEQQLPLQEDGFFDFVLLNAPYNPTYEGINAALHADGGDDGQREFAAQTKLIPGILRRDGYCVAHHMGLIDGEGKLSVSERIREAFSDYNQLQEDELAKGTPANLYRAEGRYIKVIDKDHDVELFLQEQYRAFLSSDKYKPGLTAYIDSLKKRYKKFTLLYLEYRKRVVAEAEVPEISLEEDEHCKGRPRADQAEAQQWKWASRIWLHRCIVEHATSAITLPWPALITDHLISKHTLTGGESPPEHASFSRNDGASLLHSPMRLLDQWLSELPPHLARPFDVILVESVPFTRDRARLPHLMQEAAVWLLDSEGEGEGEARAQAWFSHWTQAVQRLHHERIAPFLHPAYLGTAPTQNGDRAPGLSLTESVESSDWNPVLHSFLPTQPKVPYPQVRPPQHRDGERLMDKPYDEFDSHFFHSRKRITDYLNKFQGKTATQESLLTPMPSLTRTDGIRFFLGRQPLKDLGVDEMKSYGEECKKRIDEIKRKLPAEGDMSTEDLWRYDLEYCQSSLHGLVAAAPVMEGLKWSHLLSVPLDLSDPLYNPSQLGLKGGAISTFRGSIFIFVGSTTADWTPDKEDLLLELARLATLLYAGRFGVMEMQRVSDSATDDTRGILSHQIKEASYAVDKAWWVTPKRWQEIEKHFRNDPSLQPYLADVRIAPNPELYRALSSTLLLWSLSYKLKDVFPKGRLPATLAELSRQAWAYANDKRRVHSNLNRDFNVSNEDIRLSWLTSPAGNRKLDCDPLHFWTIDTAKLYKKDRANGPNEDDESDLKQLTGLLRIFVVVIENFFEHTDDGDVLRVEVKKQGASSELLFRNTLYHRETRAKEHAGFRGLDLIRYLCRVFLGLDCQPRQASDRPNEFILPIRIDAFRWLRNADND